MDIKVSLDGLDLDAFMQEVEQEIVAEFAAVGEEAVAYAKEHGSYHDVTGRLRRSNKYKASLEGLKIYNDAPYAQAVESKGYEVITGAALYAEKRLKEKIGSK